MKQVLILVTGLILVSCGNQNHYRSGRLRKLRVKQSDRQEEVAEEVEETTPSKGLVYEYHASSEDTFVEAVSEGNKDGREATVLEKECVVESMVDNVLERDVAIETVEDISGNHRDVHSKAIEQHELKGLSKRKLQIQEAKRQKKLPRWSEIDWYELMFNIALLAAVVLIIIGLILEPTITLIIILGGIALLAFLALRAIGEAFSMLLDF